MIKTANLEVPDYAKGRQDKHVTLKVYIVFVADNFWLYDSAKDIAYAKVCVKAKMVSYVVDAKHISTNSKCTEYYARSSEVRSISDYIKKLKAEYKN